MSRCAQKKSYREGLLYANKARAISFEPPTYLKTGKILFLLAKLKQTRFFFNFFKSFDQIKWYKMKVTSESEVYRLVIFQRVKKPLFNTSPELNRPPLAAKVDKSVCGG